MIQPAKFKSVLASVAVVITAGVASLPGIAQEPVADVLI